MKSYLWKFWFLIIRWNIHKCRVIRRVPKIAENDCYFRPVFLSICLSVRLPVHQSDSQAISLSVCLSIWNNSAHTGRVFMKLNIWRFFETSSLIKPEKNTWIPIYIYDNITLVVGRTTVVVEIIKTPYVLPKLFPKILPLWDKAKKYGGGRHAGNRW